jgi:hypothetical protein
VRETDATCDHDDVRTTENRLSISHRTYPLPLNLLLASSPQLSDTMTKMMAWMVPNFLFLSQFLCGAWAWSFATRSLLSTSSVHRNEIVRRSFWLAAYSRYRDDDEIEDDEDEDESERDDGSDWMQAELTLLNLPTEPSPDLNPETVALACCRSLQWVDYPTELAGLKRCFDFFTFECRKTVTARQGGNTVERFCEYGLLSPALQPFMGATRVELGNATFTPAQAPLRGALASFPVVITGASVLSVQYPSGIGRQGITTELPKTYMVVRLEQQRRPPGQGCWLVKEVLDVRHAFAGDMGNAHVGG